ncbi:MAG: glutamate-1-semialdehyde 2,1-aminomutase [Sedimentisphaerales bacterium]|nr:glutamate-1-semialdehyde 2,1-aminomutase [Sedimentisphaerales bacterium]
MKSEVGTWTRQKSIMAYKNACNYIPGGVNSPVRAFGGTGIEPLFIAQAKGSKIYDIDGNEYIDYVCSWGPMILGHAHPQVLKAISKAAKNGTSFGAPTQAETELAGKIIAAFDSIKKVRLVSSGTEAVMTAIRLARGFTKKDMIIKMIGCYHGHSDCLLAAAGSGVAEGNSRNQTVASSAGVPNVIAKQTIVVPYNDIESVKTAFKTHKGKIAAVLVEPVAANMGVVLPVDGYLKKLRDLCSNEDSLLIFDEVITGFRLAPGGAQQVWGIKADITCLGKIIGGGLPAAAVGGRAEIMNLLAPLGPVYQAGTLSGNPLATAAANATLDILVQKGSYEKLESSACELEKGFSKAAKDAKIPMTINRIGSIMSCFFIDRKVLNFADVKSTNIKVWKQFFLKMLEQGIYLAPSAYEAMFVSFAHTKEDISKTIEAAQKSFTKITN